jgi:uncharacterized protein YwqG
VDKPCPDTAEAIFRLIVEHKAPCLVLSRSQSGKSSIGGRPTLRQDIAWPVWEGRPQSFLSQIDLANAKRSGGPDWLPCIGTLFFFYDSEQSTWGFSPEDRGSWTVVFDETAVSVAPVIPRPTPPEGCEFPAQTLLMTADESLPSVDRLEIDTSRLSDIEWNRLDSAINEAEPGYPSHRIGGWPQPIQNDDMELESQLASNGVNCGEAGAYQSDAALLLAPGASEWRLLLQLDSDDDSDMMWGDSGRLYFWIRERDARARDFSKVWMILQCC